MRPTLQGRTEDDEGEVQFTAATAAGQRKIRKVRLCLLLNWLIYFTGNKDIIAIRIYRLNTQLKERKQEIKRLEKRLKSETQTSAENAELQSRIETLEKEVSALQKKLNEEQKKHAREVQQLQEGKKRIQHELNDAEAEVDRLSTQVEEKGQVSTLSN